MDKNLTRNTKYTIINNIMKNELENWIISAGNKIKAITKVMKKWRRY